MGLRCENLTYRTSCKTGMANVVKFRDLCAAHRLSKTEVLGLLIERFNDEYSGVEPKVLEPYIDAIRKEPPLISESAAYKRFEQFCVDRKRNLVDELDKALRHYLKSCKHYVNFI